MSKAKKSGVDTYYVVFACDLYNCSQSEDPKGLTNWEFFWILGIQSSSSGWRFNVNWRQISWTDKQQTRPSFKVQGRITTTDCHDSDSDTIRVVSLCTSTSAKLRTIPTYINDVNSYVDTHNI